MSFNHYYTRYNAFQPFITDAPHPQLHICVVIPSYKEPAIIPTLQSLWQSNRSQCAVEVIVAVNSPEDATDEALRLNQQTIADVCAFAQTHSDEKLRFFYTHAPNLTKKHAGAGWARKVGMDEAVRRFEAVGNAQGIIVGFDADSTCSNDYLTEIERHFATHKKCTGVSLNFEHPLSGTEYPEPFYNGIALYELHLRYLNQALVYTGFPFAFHTVGSAFAVRAIAYIQQGGMNRRTAGEDFYFLHKIIAQGSFMNLPSATVYPSPRPSMRVPFGTGATITKMIEQNDFSYQTYNAEVFTILKEFFAEIEQLYKCDVVSSMEKYTVLHSFLTINNFTEALAEIRANSSSPENFVKRFYAWFTAFRVVKFLNYSHETVLKKQDVVEATNQLLSYLHIPFFTSNSIEMLQWFRMFEREKV